MGQQRKINYQARNFSDVRNELINFIKQYYPDLLSDFSDSSIGSMLIDLNSAIADNLSYHTDRTFNETQLDYAQERRSVLSMARTLGLKVPGLRPSVVLIDITATLPVFGDTWDIRYAPVIRYGSQVVGGGQTFELVDDVDFSSSFTSGGVPNRLIIPNVDSNGNLINYTIVKREIAINGTSKVFRKVITETDVKPFLEIILPDNNVLNVEQIITQEGTNIVSIPSIDDFLNFDDRWFEVDSLAEDKIFIEDTAIETDNEAVKRGKWVNITKRFISEYTNNGFLKLTFGSGTNDLDTLDQIGQNEFTTLMANFINTTALGEIPKPNQTMFIRYRVGGGSSSNVGPNIINSLGNFIVNVNGANDKINQTIKSSIRVNNPLPALGGTDNLSIEYIKNLIKFNFASQNRAVTINDYTALVNKMPGKFGVPFRLGVGEEENKIVLHVLGLNSSGKLTNESTSTLKENIASYLSDYRMINDYVIVKDGKIINLGFEIDLYVDKSLNQSQIINNTIQKVKDYFNVNNWEMGENIYLSQLIEQINNVNGVYNVIDIRVYNKFGGNYSLNEISQPYIDSTTRQIDISDTYSLFGEPNTLFEIKFIEKDVVVRVKS